MAHNEKNEVENEVNGIEKAANKKNSIQYARDQMMGSQYFGNDTEYHQDEVVDQNIDMTEPEDQENISDDCSQLS